MKYNSKFVPKNQDRTGEILLDTSKSGKKRDWKRYKEQSLAVSAAYFPLQELMKYGEKLFSCGSYLLFKACPHGHIKKLVEAYFCRARGCPMCQWRKSLVMFHQVLELIHAHKAKYKSDVPLLLTLTVPNVPSSELKSMLDNMQKAWHKLTKRASFKRSIRSSFRSLEVTYNDKTNTFHPHFHVLLFVPKNYFDKKYGLYIQRNEWLFMWQQVTGMSEITQVDIRRVRKKSSRKPLDAIAAEVAKYATKPSSYIKESPEGLFEASGHVVETLHYALKGRRLIAFGGLFNDLRKTLKQVDIEEADLVQITDEEKPCLCSICQSGLVDELYRWYAETRQYVA
jgi:plasmid rolling circle replication initiator protein Rep